MLVCGGHLPPNPSHLHGRCTLPHPRGAGCGHVPCFNQKAEAWKEPMIQFGLSFSYCSLGEDKDLGAVGPKRMTDKGADRNSAEPSLD